HIHLIYSEVSDSAHDGGLREPSKGARAAKHVTRIGANSRGEFAMQSVVALLSSAAFMPHGMCYLWQPGILALHLVSASLISLAYFSIPFPLLYFVRRRTDLQFNWMLVCFAVFIVACGATHVMEIWTVWHPDYWVSGALKAVTAAASVPTAILLVKLVPVA